MTRAGSVSISFTAAVLMGSTLVAQTAVDVFQEPPWARRQHALTKFNQPVDRYTDSRSSEPIYGGSDTVSLHDLSHQVPAKALREYEKAHKEVDAHKLDGALQHFERAVDIDPEFTDARNDLAACYIKLTRASDAVNVLTPATTQGIGNAITYTNLAVAMMMLNDQHAAEEAARKGAEMDRVGTRTKLILALTLVMRNQFTEETTSLLRTAEPDFPQAVLLLGRALAARGDIEGAKAKMTAYLDSGERSGRALAQEWLDTLNRFTNRARTSIR